MHSRYSDDEWAIIEARQQLSPALVLECIGERDGAVIAVCVHAHADRYGRLLLHPEGSDLLRDITAGRVPYEPYVFSRTVHT
jgi:hypothetical protein